ncbi:type II toxin-antitoxin system RelE/ParE family toxin [Patescibacteria group bacterium]
MTLYLTKDADKSLKKIPSSEQKKVSRKLINLESSIEKGKKLEGELKNKYSLKTWPYRIIYLISKQKIIVLNILHRQEAYR